MNAMVMVMVSHSNQPTEVIYHVSSSVRNPVKYETLIECGHQYFCEHPRVEKDGTIVETKKLPIFSTMESFRRYMSVRYKLPLEVRTLYIYILNN